MRPGQGKSNPIAAKMQAALEPTAAAADAKTANNGFHAYSLGEFLALKVRPRPYLLAPILRERDLAMVYAWRGVGKTWFAHGVALAVALGGRFLRWQAPLRNFVLLVDGEMPTGALQDRLRMAIAGHSDSIELDDVPLSLIAADAYDTPMPSLATKQGQALVESSIGDARLVILDNISTLLELGDENESESWNAAQSWLLSLRRNGIAVLLVHHAGKAGAQRGTSRREDILDLSIALKRPPEYRASEGARFEIIFEKSRHLAGSDAEGFEAQLEVDADGKQLWTMTDPVEAKRNRALEMLDVPGVSVRDVATELCVPKTTVHRWKQQGRSIMEQVEEKRRDLLASGPT